MKAWAWGTGALLVVAGFSVAQSADGASRLGGGERYVDTGFFATRAPVLGQHGMAATAQPLASEAAIDILKKGGSAVDAAIAANAVLGLVEPVSNGMGGDLFAIVWDPKTKHLYGYNSSGRSAMGRTFDDLKRELKGKTHIPPFGSLPVTVPGTVDGWFALHDKFGKLKMAADLAPAIDYAKNGFPVTQLIAYYWQHNMAIFEKSKADIEELGNARQTYLIDGHAPAQGEVFRNPDLARTFETIAKGGRNAFYKGIIAKKIDAYFRRIGGDLRYEDFAAHNGEWVEPVSVNYRGYDVYELPPNTQGVAALEMLQILKGYDLRKMGPGSADALTAMIEAKRLAYEDLAKFFGDPAFVKVPVKELISGKYAAERRKLISLDRANPDIGPGNPGLSNGDTTYFATADKDGMMVSIIQSNYRGMGSGLVPDGLGFMFQDRGELFSLDPASPNVYAPGKRPFHTIIPAFVMKDGQPWMSFGLMGGDMQPQGHVQVLVNMIDFGMNVQEAGDAARFYHHGTTEVTGEPAQGVGVVELESGISPDVKAELERRGFKTAPGSGGFGGYQAIKWDAKTHVYWGASEMRKDGEAIGY